MKQCDMPCPFTPLLPNLKRRARRLTTNTAYAKNLVQDTIVRVIARQQSSENVNNLPAYTMRTLHDQSRMQWCRHAPPEELNDDASTLAIVMDRLICA